MSAAKVTLGMNYMTLEMAVFPQALDKLLSFASVLKEPIKVKATDNRGRDITKKIYTEQKRLYRRDPGNCPVTGGPGVLVTTYPGFAARVIGALQELGFEVQFVDGRRQFPRLDLERATARLRPHQKPVALEALAAGGGMIQCPTGYGKTFLTAGIIEAFDQAELDLRGTPVTVVVSPSVDLCMKNWRSLEKILSDRDVGIRCTGKTRMTDDIMVITPESLPHIPRERVGLLIFDECHGVSDVRANTILSFPHAIRYGMSATPTGRGDGGDLLVEGALGPVVVRRTFKQAVAEGAIVPVQVYWLELPRPQDSWRYYVDKQTTQRHGLWRNNNYNQLIAALMEDIIPKEMQALTVVGTLQHMDWLLHSFRHRDLVAHTHAEKKAEGFSHVQSRSKKQREDIYRGMENGSIKRCISSGIFRTGVDFPDLGLIIKAEGMASEIIAQQLPGRTTRLADGKTHGILIDFWPSWDRVDKTGHGDFEDGALLKDAKERRRVYTKILELDQAFVTPEQLYHALHG